ncbi:hypothetical protein V6N12_036112 [Hibiscus sabdariffa]|uniref:Uncharacterized protein n=1 Tax=Hibiscus sabdariffa TaxID=183260 RepID=A0ABR2EPN8_9ROSI
MLALTSVQPFVGVVNNRSPDEVIVDETMVLDRPRSPLLEDAQRQIKKGCSRDNNILQQTDTSTIARLDTAATAAHIQKITREQRNPDVLYGPWMQAPSHRMRPTVARQGVESTRTSNETHHRGSRFAALSDDVACELTRKHESPVDSLLNQAAGGMASGILDATHGSALAPASTSKQKNSGVLQQITTKSVIEGGTRGELRVSDLPHVNSHDRKAQEQSVIVASKDRIVSSTTSLNKEYHTVAVSTVSSSKGGAKGSLRVSTVQKVSSRGRKKDNKAMVLMVVSYRLSSLRADLNQVVMDTGKEDDGAADLGDAPEAAVQWSDNATYDSQIRDAMLD